MTATARTSAGTADGAGIYIGLMSGTSLDGVDGVMAVIEADTSLRVIAQAGQCFSPAFAQTLLELNAPGDNEIHRAALAANALVEHYAEVVVDLLTRAGRGPSEIRAIGAHGQTVRHRPGAFDGIGYTIQLNQPALLAERCGIDVVADFRSRDLAAGGQGAPLVPLFHRRVFGRAGRTTLVANIGGISNLSLLGGDGSFAGFDCGPGNVLIDGWCRRHTGQAFDDQGHWAATGRIVEPLLEQWLAEPFFAQAPPKSTGRDLFDMAWIDRQLAHADHGLAAADVQATLTELTARTLGNEISRLPDGGDLLVVCGGGALNQHLMSRLRCALPSMAVESSDRHSLAPLQVEAAAFAWLAHAAVHRLPGNHPGVTGARGFRVLGALYPGAVPTEAKVP